MNSAIPVVLSNLNSLVPLLRYCGTVFFCPNLLSGKTMSFLRRPAMIEAIKQGTK